MDLLLRVVLWGLLHLARHGQRCAKGVLTSQWGRVRTLSCSPTILGSRLVVGQPSWWTKCLLHLAYEQRCREACFICIYTAATCSASFDRSIVPPMRGFHKQMLQATTVKMIGSPSSLQLVDCRCYPLLVFVFRCHRLDLQSCTSLARTLS